MILKEDNIEELIKNGVTIIIVHDEDRKKFQKYNNRVIELHDNFQREFPGIPCYYLNVIENPKSIEYFTKDSLEFFPFIYFIYDKEIIDVYFGVGIEETKEFIKKNLYEINN